MPGFSGSVEEGLAPPTQMTSSLRVGANGPTPGSGNDCCGAGRGGQSSERDTDEGDEHLGRLSWDISAGVDTKVSKALAHRASTGHVRLART